MPTVNQLPWRAQYFDTQGFAPVVASGYFVQTFLTRTTTPADTYSDAAGTVLNTNPIELDADGRADIFIEAGVSYTFTLTRPVVLGGGVVEVFDDISGVPAAFDSGVFLPLAGGDMMGPLTLAGNATAALMAVTKQQLDTSVASASAGVSGALTAANAATAAANAATAAANAATAAANGVAAANAAAIAAEVARQVAALPAPPSGTPAGVIVAWGTDTAPSGWFACEGAALSRSTFSDLFAAIGTTWGAGDGSTTFAVPDFRGEFLRGWANARAVDTGRLFASQQDSANLAHSHTLTDSLLPNGAVIPSTTFKAISSFSFDNDTTGLEPTTSSGGAESRPRNRAVLYIIKT